MLDEGVAVGGVDERDVEGLGVVQRLLHPGTHRVGVGLGLDDREREVGLVEQDVVRPLLLPPLVDRPALDDPSVRERDLLTHLPHPVPPGALDGRGDKLGADVALGELSLVHGLLGYRLHPFVTGV